MKRKEDPRLLRGSSRFVADLVLPNLLHLAIYRSKYAHAKIDEMDLSEVLQQQGVVAAYSGKDLQNLTLPTKWVTDSIPGMKSYPAHCLAVGKVRFVGEPVAAVLAEDQYTAEDALDYVRAKFTLLPPVIDAEIGLGEGAPLLYEEWGDNIMNHWHFKGGDPDRALREADLVVDERIAIGRYTAMPMEPRGVAAQFDLLARPKLTVWNPSQVPHIVRTLYGETFGIPEAEIRVIMPEVGGSFGIKHPLYPEEILVPHLAMKLGRPVKWIENRLEHLTASNHARENVHYVKAGFKKDGTILGIKDRVICNNGVFHPYQGAGSQIVLTFFIPGTYRIQDYEVEMLSIVTNKSPWGPYRGYGKDASCMVIERIMNIAAAKLDIDPAEIRLRNFIQPDEFPYTSISGPVYDSGNYPACLRKLLELANYQDLRREQKELRKKRKYLGIGLAYALEPASESIPNSLYAGYEATTIRIDPSGKVTVLTGLVAHGTGHETAISQIVADTLGVNYEDVTVVEGDTQACPYGLGSWSSRFAFTGSPSVIGAATKLREKILKAAAHLFEARLDDLEPRGGRVYVKGMPSKFLNIKDIVNIINTRPYMLPPDFEPGLDATFYYKTPNVRHTPDHMGRLAIYPTFPNNVNIAVVEVNPKTGHVEILKYFVIHDCGKIINPMLVEGQIYGGVAQGIGGALYEELTYGEDGQMLANTFMDYLLPTTKEMPDIVVGHHETPSPFNPAGFKGCGEGGAIGSPVAIANAVEDALAPFGVKISQIPLTPERIWRLVHRSSSGLKGELGK